MKNSKLIWILIGVVVVILLFYFLTKNKEKKYRLGGETTPRHTEQRVMEPRHTEQREAIKCCQKRDKNCKCIQFDWRAAKNCAEVACGSTGNL